MIPHVHVANQGAQRTVYSARDNASRVLAICKLHGKVSAACPCVACRLALARGVDRPGGAARQGVTCMRTQAERWGVSTSSSLETPLDPGARVSGAARRDGGRGRLCATGVRGASRREFRAIANDQERAASRPG